MHNAIDTLRDLAALRASDVMMSPVITAHMWDSIRDVARIFVEDNISSVAVVDLDDRPLGVITKSDLARYDRERATLVVAERDKRRVYAQATSERVEGGGFHLEPEDVTIENWMTPCLFDVHPDTLMKEVVGRMVRLSLHHMFVTDPVTKKIKGVITTFDVLMMMQRLLNPQEAAGE